MAREAAPRGAVANAGIPLVGANVDLFVIPVRNRDQHRVRRARPPGREYAAEGIGIVVDHFSRAGLDPIGNIFQAVAGGGPDSVQGWQLGIPFDGSGIDRRAVFRRIATANGEKRDRQNSAHPITLGLFFHIPSSSRFSSIQLPGSVNRRGFLLDRCTDRHPHSIVLIAKFYFEVRSQSFELRQNKLWRASFPGRTYPAPFPGAAGARPSRCPTRDPSRQRRAFCGTGRSREIRTCPGSASRSCRIAGGEKAALSEYRRISCRNAR